MSADVEVLVVGAGPTGLTLAAVLAAHGVRPRVIDRALDRVHESRALAIQPRTLEVLAGLGVTGQLVDEGNRGVRLRLHAGRRQVSAALFDLGMADTAYPYLLFLSQAETERVLAEHLAAAGVTVERGVELVGLRAGDDAMVAALSGGRFLSAAYVVGCDGMHSAVRTAAGIPFEGGSYPQSFVLADAEADGLEPGAVHGFLTASGLLFFFPLGTPATWRLLAMRPPTEDVPPGTPVTLEDLQALADTYTGRSVRLRDPVWMTNFRLHHRAAARYRSGRVFLAGDAAHVHSPAGGQGMNTGVQDAVNLGWKLASALRGLTDASILDTYDPERAPVGRTVVRFTDRIFRIATSGHAGLRFARARIAPLLVPLVLNLRFGRGYAFRSASQLAIRYRSSPLSVDGSGAPRRGPRAGDRLPDASFVHNGQLTTLHAAVASAGWHLVRCGLVAEPVPEAVDVVSIVPGPDGLCGVDGQVSRRLGLRRGEAAQFLVRPDGYIGYRCGAEDGGGLRAYVRRWVAAAPR